MTSNLRQAIFLALAAAGLGLTWYHNLAFMAEHGTGIDTFIEHAMVNHAASSLGWDVTIAFATYALWVSIEARRLGMRYGWTFIVLGATIAFAFSFPLFLFFRERKLAARKA